MCTNVRPVPQGIRCFDEAYPLCLECRYLSARDNIRPWGDFNLKKKDPLRACCFDSACLCCHQLLWNPGRAAPWIDELTTPFQSSNLATFRNFENKEYHTVARIAISEDGTTKWTTISFNCWGEPNYRESQIMVLVLTECVCRAGL
jgi:hypothetical protein